MAEDDNFNNDLEDDEVQSPGRSKPRQRPTKQRKQEKKNKYCRPRIDQLAIPNRRLILALYQDHASHLPREKANKIKMLLQELYAMSPEETEKYFAYIKGKVDEMSKRKDIKFMLKKLDKKRKRKKQYKQAYELLKTLFIKGMEFALKTPVPPLISVRLRNLSNIILEQICDLKNVKVPNRDDADRTGAFLIKVADWMAIAIEHLYYGIHLKKNQELEKIEKEHIIKEVDKASEPGKETEVEKLKEPGYQTDNETDEEAVFSQPLLMSEME
ncbi:hypothetical protein GWI33_008980 [Rhynchophorus ferrugineus]|uniref:Uncharacterized protein n=1 Tax=Rhynchophorus ferrugineus TaxID=354439 RepID=A0A834IG19_RHYFE|nr:hypothetical protein GWI33_008980 [Rhynchophorus ferrugineus]